MMSHADPTLQWFRLGAACWITSARITNDDVELIIEADDAERTTALALAFVRNQAPLNVHDIGADKSAERLRQLSEEVSRIASTLARLSADPAPTRPSFGFRAAG